MALSKETTPSGQKDAATSLVSPMHWLGAYSDFITKNASAVSQIESGLRSLTYLIPGRFRESEVASESLHSGVQLLSLYHDSLLSSAVSRLPASARPHPTPHNRYTRFWMRKSPTYRRLALLLQTITYTELLWEMTARRRGERARWRVVVLLEALKAICRLLLLRLTNSRPLVSPPLPERDVDPAALEESVTAGEASRDGVESPPSEHSAAAASDDSINTATGKWTMPRTGLSLPDLPDPADISTYLLSKVLTADDVKPPKALLHRVSGLGELAEWMHILRPLVYVLALQRWGTGANRGNWRPWLIGFSLEYGARQLAKRDAAERFAGGLRGLTGLEREELRRRGWAMGWWVMRGAFYENVTKGWVQSVAGSLRGKLLLDIVGNVIDDYEFLWEQYYFPTATM